jgi:hypothetical protein
MAFPDYSILIVESANLQSGATERATYLFTDVKDAQVAYRAEVAQPYKRVFLFEQPQPTKFHRDDSLAYPVHPVSGQVYLDQWD